MALQKAPVLLQDPRLVNVPLMIGQAVIRSDADRSLSLPPVEQVIIRMSNISPAKTSITFTVLSFTLCEASNPHFQVASCFHIPPNAEIHGNVLHANIFHANVFHANTFHAIVFSRPKSQQLDHSSVQLSDTSLTYSLIFVELRDIRLLPLQAALQPLR
jgi:hypothetical protein